MSTALFAQAGKLADDIAALIARQTKPRHPHGTARTAANDGHYGTTRAFAVSQRRPNGRCQTVQVIASTHINAEIRALDLVSFPGR